MTNLGARDIFWIFRLFISMHFGVPRFCGSRWPTISNRCLIDCQVLELASLRIYHLDPRGEACRTRKKLLFVITRARSRQHWFFAMRSRGMKRERITREGWEGRGDQSTSCKDCSERRWGKCWCRVYIYRHLGGLHLTSRAFEHEAFRVWKEPRRLSNRISEIRLCTCVCRMFHRIPSHIDEI